MAPITIRGNTLDPANLEGVDIPSDASHTNYVLVQLKDEMTQDTVSALEARDAKLLKRIDGDTWLLHYKDSDLSRLEAIDDVQYALVYADLFVVRSSLKGASPTDTASRIPLVAIVLHEDARSSSDEALAEIRRVANPQITSAYGGVFHVQVNNQQDLERIAQLDSVQAIEEATPIEPMNDRLRELSSINYVNQQLKKAMKDELTGAAQVVAVADTGVDTTHPAFSAPDKIASTYFVNMRENANDEIGHGTHVAGTVLGGPVKDWKDLDVEGMAPGARLNVQAILFAVNADWTSEQLYEQAYSAEGGNCRIHSNSWGTPLDRDNPVQYAYTATTAGRIDQWAFEHPDFLIVRSAGNDGWRDTPTHAQVGTYAVSKNVLTVGATFTDRPTTDDGVVDYSEANLQTYKSKAGIVADFSSRGPVLNTKRTKPDVVAPGVGILSCRTSSPAALGKQRDWEKFYGHPDGGFKPGSKLIFCSGTSMATPAVAGYAALLREALVKWKGITAPSAALMKALLINGTDDIKVSKNIQGFGEVNIDKVLSPVRVSEQEINSGGGRAGHAEGEFNQKSTAKTWNAMVPKPSQSRRKLNLQVTMVYHDAPGAALQNCMNLSVTYNGTTTKTYRRDNPENVHRLILEDVTPGERFTIAVEPKLIAITNSRGIVPWAVAWNVYEPEQQHAETEEALLATQQVLN